MMHRLIMGAAGLVAASLVAVPAVLGLSGNSSFSRDIRVPVPSGARQVHFAEPAPSVSPHGTPAPRSSERTEDHPGRDVASSGTADDHGGLRRDPAGSGGSDDRFGRRAGHRGADRPSTGADDRRGGDHGSDGTAGDRSSGGGDRGSDGNGDDRSSSGDNSGGRGHG